MRLREVNAQLSTARADADQANRAKSDFLAKMSHEIRTPMNGVLGMADVLRETSLNRNQIEMVDLIQSSAFSLLHIINDILDFSKIEAGRLDLDIQEFDPVECVEGICAMLKNMALKKDVLFTVFTDPELPRLLRGDSLRLQQVFINLINNAIKFSSKGSKLGRVSIHANILSTTPERVVLEFTVKDNGIGMDDAAQARLFTPFMQEDSSTSRIFGGTGLGLVITHNLVELMGGSISVTSALNRGSVFKVRIPFVSGLDLVQEQKQPSGVEGLSCLLIGDDESLVSELSVYLEHGGAKVMQVADVISAALCLEKNGGDDKWLWIVDMEGPPSAKERYFKELASTHKSVISYPALIVQRGELFTPVDEFHFISIDGNAMSRSAFLGEVFRAASQLKSDYKDAYATSAKPAIGQVSGLKTNDESPLVLVAEDNETNQKVILRQLEVLGYQGQIANNGGEALEYWRTGNYALLLTDLHMPHMDGYELCAAIRAEEEPSQRLPIILLTANVLANQDPLYISSDMDGYMTKPARLGDFQKILDKWVVEPNKDN